MYLIVGLGNPAEKFEKTRHNIGFEVIDALAEKYDIEMNRKLAKAICGTGRIEGRKVLLAKPQTYMNLSGNSVSRLMHFFRLRPEKDLIVVFDDIHLDPGNIRIRNKGSAGGHNGGKDIIAKIGTEQFARVRVGVGEKPEDRSLSEHVLGRFSRAERESVEGAVADAADALVKIVCGEAEEAMNRYNRRKQ